MAKTTSRARGGAAPARPATPRPTSGHRPFAKLAKAAKPPAAKAPAPAPAPAASEEDERLRFARMMRGVEPLGKARPKRAVPTTPPTTTEPPSRARLSALVAEGVRMEVFDDGETLEGRRLDVDPSEIRKLRQLRYAVDGTLDLHGLDAAQARAKVESFLRRRRLQGDRAVLIIHGKGAHSVARVAVLRGELAAWLSQGRAQRDVAAFSSVADRAAGSGAVFVLLAR